MQVKVNPIKRQGSGLLKLKSFRDIIFRPGKRKITIKLFLAISIIFLVYSSAMFTVGILAQRNLGFSNFIAKPIILDNFDILTRYINSIFAKPEVITIDISFKNYQKLEYTRKCALAKGTVYGIPNEWVNAKIRYKDQTIPARVRLKGATAAEHLDEKKWSFRIRI